MAALVNLYPLIPVLRKFQNNVQMIDTENCIIQSVLDVIYEMYALKVL